jgi:DNA-binding IclR family transcriptional regulator
MYERISTYEQLEILVRLAESPNPAGVSSIAEDLGISPDAALEALDALVDANLLARLGRELCYRYAPGGPALDTAAKQLVVLYRANRFGVVKAMADNSLQRLRGSTLHTFAECFLIGGPKKDG